MEAIKDTVLKVFQQISSQKTKAGGEDPSDWLKKVLTKKELGHIKFNYFKKGILGVNVDSSSRLYSLSLQKEGLLSKLKKEHNSVKEIRFHIGEVK